MIHFVFKNMDRSDFAKTAILDRLQRMVEKFPELRGQKMQVTLELLNSPIHAGPDRFLIRLNVISGRYRGIRLQKSASNLYQAVADLIDHLLERLNRFGDRHRVKSRAQARRLAQTSWPREELDYVL